MVLKNKVVFKPVSQIAKSKTKTEAPKKEKPTFFSFEDFKESEISEYFIERGFNDENLDSTYCLIYILKNDSIRRVGFERAFELEEKRFIKKGKNLKEELTFIIENRAMFPTFKQIEEYLNI